jgi:Lrp/AsnC family leucine-responsive transcriptional regulator
MDAIDRRILRALHGEARLTNAELAERVGLSPSPCWSRVRRLEQSGVIRGYRAELDQAKLGLPDTVIIEVMTEKHDEEQLRRFEQAIADMPEVIEAWLATGEYDYILKHGRLRAASAGEDLPPARRAPHAHGLRPALPEAALHAIAGVTTRDCRRPSPAAHGRRSCSAR